MSVNLDDPLAGILSDGSDDSFFDDDILGKKKPVKKKSTPIAEKKLSSLFDLEDTERPKTSANVVEGKKEALFDLGGDTKTSKPISSPASLKRSISKDSFKITETKHKTLEVKSPAKTKSTALADKLDILDLGSDKKELTKLEKGKSSQSILDDILRGSKPGGSQVKPATATKSQVNQDFDFDSFLGKSEPKTKTVKPNVENVKKFKQESGKKKSDDWLGIFQDDDETQEEDDTGMPAWLGGDKKKKEEKKVKAEPAKEVAKETTKEVEPPQDKEVFTQPIEALSEQVIMPKLVPHTVLQGSTEDITAEGAALYLQQTESQLMVAMQLKAQEERLAAMQTRQKESQRVHREAAQAHHEQLDAMLNKQAEQRLQMQTIISSHQQRISQRIKALLGTETETYGEVNLNEGDNNMERETPHSKEKKQLLQLVQSLQDNHDKEIDLMETSYRRQLAFLEISLHQGEDRMKEESDKLIKFYSEKIQWLEEHHNLYKKMTDENLNSLTMRHKVENEMIRQQHLDNVRILQEHHAALMENIKNAVKQEQVLIQESASFSSDLKELVQDVKENKIQCQELVDKVQHFADNTKKDSERSLIVRETQINDMIQQLKKERDNFDAEKAENREMVKMLETRLKQMTTMIEEESASLKQKKMEFEFEKATFSKQTEFAKNILKKQDEDMKILREDIQKEYQEKTSRIEEEKIKAQKDSAVIAKEKVSINSLKQDLEKMKGELEAQLEEVTEERSKLNVEKQQLHMEEQRIMARSRDYDLLAKTAIDKQSQADKKYSKAEFLQKKYEDRIRRIQEHVVSLNVREKQIAREKVTLSRERLNLHNERKQNEGRQCSLCKTQNVPEYNFPSYTIPESFLSISRDYKNDSERRDYRNVDVINIERDLASIVSRNNYAKEDGNDGKFQSVESEPFKELMDPKFMMLRLDVQKVLSNLDHNKRNDNIDRNNEEFHQNDQANDHS